MVFYLYPVEVPMRFSLTMISNCQLFFQNFPEAVLLLDKDGFVTYANPAATAITGYAADELLHKPMSLLYTNKNDDIKADYERGLANKAGKLVSEGWKTKKDDTQFWCELTLCPLHDEEQKIAGYTCILRDVSARKTRELELRHSEERYRLMVASVRDYAIFMLDSTGHILTWNEGARRAKGYLPDEIIGKHFSIFYTAEDLATNKPERELKIATETGKYEEEGWRIRKDGSLFWANVVITALFNEQNNLVGFSKVTRDLTERQQNQEMLRRSEEQYRSLVEQVTDYGIFMLDEKGQIISWNEGARKINGYTAEEIIGKYFSIFYPEEDLLNGKPSYELKVAREKGKYEEEGWRIRKDGSRFWANVVITAIYNREGLLIGYSKVTRDLTERKEAEKALRDSHDSYRMLANELRATNAELTYANQELEQFTSIVSHDLQEPIRTIKSFLQLIEMKLNEAPAADVKTYIGKAILAANRMRELIRNLLHYSQLSKGDLVEQEVSVHEIINEAIQNVRTSIDASGAQIVVQNEVDTLRGDRVQLVQLIQNLLSNAVKFTSSAEPVVEIRCWRDAGQINFAVSDNGIGIAETDLGKVFEIFRRLHTKKNYSGTGIGLAICKKIVERHSGRIWPESEPGKGTTFYFTLQEKHREAIPSS